jgi:hypothetical protein
VFLCDKCHSKTCNCWALSRSLGPCENCRKTNVCIDCRGGSPIARPKPKKKPAKKIKKPTKKRKAPVLRA